MRKKIAAALKFATAQHKQAQHKLETYSSGHWINPKEEKRVLDWAEMNRYEAENALIIWCLTILILS